MKLKKNKQLWEDLTPKYSLGCKRVMLSEQYYSAMTRSNVRLHSSHIEKIVDQTIYTKDGKKDEIDVSKIFFCKNSRSQEVKYSIEKLPHTMNTSSGLM